MGLVIVCGNGSLSIVHITRVPATILVSMPVEERPHWIYTKLAIEIGNCVRVDVDDTAIVTAVTVVASYDSVQRKHVPSTSSRNNKQREQS